MTDKTIAALAGNNEYLSLSINQAEILRDEITEGLKNIRMYQLLGERIDKLIVQYPKEKGNDR